MDLLPLWERPPLGVTLAVKLDHVAVACGTVECIKPACHHTAWSILCSDCSVVCLPRGLPAVSS